MTRCAGQPCLYFCPANVYRLENGRIGVAWEGCVECGSCRVACPHLNIEWRFPTGGCGVSLRFGLAGKLQAGVRLEPLLIINGSLECKDGVINVMAERTAPLREADGEDASANAGDSAFVPGCGVTIHT